MEKGDTGTGVSNQIADNGFPLIVADYSIVDHYRNTLYSGEMTPIRHLARKFIEKTIRKGQCFVVLPFTHHKKLIETKTSGGLELETFLPFCNIFSESTTEFEHAPIFTISICEVRYPKRQLYLLTLDDKTAYKAKELGYKPITIEDADKILDAIPD